MDKQQLGELLHAPLDDGVFYAEQFGHGCFQHQVSPCLWLFVWNSDAKLSVWTLPRQAMDSSIDDGLIDERFDLWLHCGQQPG